jgi:hypothetical protein
MAATTSPRISEAGIQKQKDLLKNSVRLKEQKFVK